MIIYCSLRGDFVHQHKVQSSVDCIHKRKGHRLLDNVGILSQDIVRLLYKLSQGLIFIWWTFISLTGFCRQMICIVVKHHCHSVGLPRQQQLPWNNQGLKYSGLMCVQLGLWPVICHPLYTYKNRRVEMEYKSPRAAVWVLAITYSFYINIHTLSAVIYLGLCCIDSFIIHKLTTGMYVKTKSICIRHMLPRLCQLRCDNTMKRLLYSGNQDEALLCTII